MVKVLKILKIGLFRAFLALFRKSAAIFLPLGRILRFFVQTCPRGASRSLFPYIYIELLKPSPYSLLLVWMLASGRFPQPQAACSKLAGECTRRRMDPAPR